jgi:hypothetical protein
MNKPSSDEGVIQVLFERLNTQRLPRALRLKTKVDAGELLDEYDLKFLDEVFHDTQAIQALIERHPEHQAFVAKLMHLYTEISDKALENEKKA